MKVLFLISLVVIPFCAANSASIDWAGCGISKKAYVTDLAKAFEKQHGIKVNIDGGGATEGIRRVSSGQSDMGGTCRFVLPDDPREAGVGLEPIAWDALVVITHPKNPVQSLTMRQVEDIFAGVITNWKEVGGYNAEIELFARNSRISGVGRTLRKLIFADYDFEIPSTRQFSSSGPLEKAVEKSRNAIGITGVSSARLREVKILALDGVEPTYETIKSGDYRMYRPLYLVYNADSPKIGMVRKFIKFCHGLTGRDIMKKNGTLPYLEGLPLVMNQIAQERRVFSRRANPLR